VELQQSGLGGGCLGRGAGLAGVFLVLLRDGVGVGVGGGWVVFSYPAVVVPERRFLHQDVDKTFPEWKAEWPSAESCLL